MGIPSYFSHIIKSFPNIIKSLYSLRSKNTKFHSMYMDCNSIIYDAYHELNSIECEEYKSVSCFNSCIIDEVIVNIEKYITLIEPSNVIYIAFDGVAPFAKMEQQRTRRYKTSFMSKISFGMDIPKYSNSSSAMITPGTDFMCLLSSRISHHFRHGELKYKVKQIIVSAADEPGEGEHKMFQYMRQHNSKDETVAVYGLDSDLIMLSIFHCSLFQNIFIFREAPEFMKSSIPITPATPNEPYFMDISMLSGAILNEMRCSVPLQCGIPGQCIYPDQCTATSAATSSSMAATRIYDYVFLCFFLGNDFLPHFPALNIRTHGIQTLLDTYRTHIGKYSDRSFIMITSTGLKINWRYVSLFISELAKFEHQLIVEEHVARDKFGKRHFSELTEKDRETAFTNIPIIYRAEEKYIYPQEKFWEDRYYNALFQMKRFDTVKMNTSVEMKRLCMNYLEGLEWVFKYYTQGCPDWKWKYNYNYPPLLCDLQKFVPHFEIDFIKPNSNIPFSPKVQLAYVLPRDQLYLLGLKNEKMILDNYSHAYPQDGIFQWTFCRYFWESHVKLPEIKLTTLDRWAMMLK